MLSVFGCIHKLRRSGKTNNKERRLKPLSNDVKGEAPFFFLLRLITMIIPVVTRPNRVADGADLMAI